MSWKPKITKIVSASWHRNGMCGEGFYAILFDEADNGRMIASLFDTAGHCAVYSVADLSKDNVAFACGNSWRGDEYEWVLRPMLVEYLRDNDTNRVGPFAMPETPKAAS